MISASDRKNAVLLINEAITSGASCKKACERLGITERTFYRWKKRKADTDSYEDGRPSADHSDPANKIPAETRYKMSRPNVQKILYKNVQLVCLL